MTMDINDRDEKVLADASELHDEFDGPFVNPKDNKLPDDMTAPEWDRLKKVIDDAVEKPAEKPAPGLYSRNARGETNKYGPKPPNQDE